MRQLILATLALGIVSGGVSQVLGVGFDSAARYIKSGYHRNAAWPWPYVCEDRVAVREPFAIMVNNGWRRQNLLGEHHFTESGSLSRAGELRVQWITIHAPPDRREIFVERSAMNPEITEQRIAAARDYASRVAGVVETPQVHGTYLTSEGRSAAAIDAVNTRMQRGYESLPAPIFLERANSGLSGLLNQQ